MIRSVVKLPADAGWEFEVYINGVPQEPGVDFYLEGRDLIFDRPLHRDERSRCGPERHRDTVDIRYAVYSEIRLEHDAAITLDDSPGSVEDNHDPDGDEHRHDPSDLQRQLEGVVEHQLAEPGRAGAVGFHDCDLSAGHG